MNTSQFVSTVVIVLLTTLGGITVSLDQWQHATAPEKLMLIHASKLDPMLKDTLVNLVASSKWEDIDSVITDLRSEIRIRQGLSKHNDIQMEYKRIGELLFKVQSQTRDLARYERQSEFMNRLIIGDSPDTTTKETEDSPLMQTIRAMAQRDLDKLQKGQATIASEEIGAIQSMLLTISPQISAANDRFAGEHSSISWKFFAGIISTAFGAIVAAGGAVKLFFETKKLKLENLKLALDLAKA